MKLPPSARIILSLVALVVVSLLAGLLLGHRLARRQLEARNNPETWSEHVLREFDRVVKPDPAQDARIQAHLDDALRELREIRRETIASSTNVIWRLIADVEQELTPEQRVDFEAMKPRPADLDLDLLELPKSTDETPSAEQ